MINFGLSQPNELEVAIFSAIRCVDIIYTINIQHNVLLYKYIIHLILNKIRSLPPVNVDIFYNINK